MPTEITVKDLSPKLVLKDKEGIEIPRTSFEYVDLIVKHSIYGYTLKKFSSNTKEGFTPFITTDTDLGTTKFRFVIENTDLENKPLGKFWLIVNYGFTDPNFSDSVRDDSKFGSITINPQK